MKVLWKYENETLPNNPGNIKISPWIPQRDILAHPNVKVFITHGGLLGTTEAVVEGVPVLGLPIFGDQKMNMAKAVTRGYGLQIYFDDISEEKIDEALKELLENPIYSQRAKEISQRFNDRPMTPQQSVVYWTEYAVRHHGAAHLKAAAADLSFIELHLIDVYAALAAILLIILYIDYKILKFILSKCFKKSAKKVKKN
jgi:glucuronosyltransferase